MDVIVFDTPIGRLGLVAEGEAIVQLVLPNVSGALVSTNETATLRNGKRQLLEYFALQRKVFDLHLAPAGTEFRLRVWKALTNIPYGVTISYGQLAVDIGNPKAVRAVGQANHHNPLPILIPCHRVIGAAGSLTGYGGGMELKRQLLALEGLRF